MDLSKCLSSGILLILSLLMLCVEEGFSVKCIVCNSHKNTACMDNPGSLMSSNDTYMECPSDHMRCRKITQEVEDDYRVIRQCALNGEVGCLQRTGTRKIKIEYCECVGDGCNSAIGLSAPSILLSAVALLAMFRSYVL